MKRTKVYRLVAVVCLAASITLSLTACNDAIMSFDLDNITMVEMTNGSDGTIISIIDSDYLERLVQSFNDNEFLRGDSAGNRTGWGYRFRFMSGDKMQAEIAVNTDNLIIYNNRFYHNGTGAIDLRFYEELLFEVDGNDYNSTQPGGAIMTTIRAEVLEIVSNRTLRVEIIEPAQIYDNDENGLLPGVFATVVFDDDIDWIIPAIGNEVNVGTIIEFGRGITLGVADFLQEPFEVRGINLRIFDESGNIIFGQGF